jgi:uncharacterized protein (TIGR02271 family)
MADDKGRDDAAPPLSQAFTRIENEVNDPDVLRLLAEDLSVTKETVETGRVRVRVVTHQREELVDMPLARERVEVERVPIGRTIETMPPIREEGDTTIIPVVEEVLVVERRLILKEELRVRRVRTTEQHQERVILRTQEAVITRTPVEMPKTDPDPSIG